MAEWTIFGRREQQPPDPPARFVPSPAFAAMWAVYDDERRHKEFIKFLVATGRLNEGEREKPP